MRREQAPGSKSWQAYHWHGWKGHAAQARVGALGVKTDGPPADP